jgi:hypothetical protein
MKYLLSSQRNTVFVDLQDVLVLSLKLLLGAIINLLTTMLLQLLQKLLLLLVHLGLYPLHLLIQLLDRTQVLTCLRWQSVQSVHTVVQIKHSVNLYFPAAWKCIRGKICLEAEYQSSRDLICNIAKLPHLHPIINIFTSCVNESFVIRTYELFGALDQV